MVCVVFLQMKKDPALERRLHSICNFLDHELAYTLYGRVLFNLRIKESLDTLVSLEHTIEQDPDIVKVKMACSLLHSESQIYTASHIRTLYN